MLYRILSWAGRRPSSHSAPLRLLQSYTGSRPVRQKRSLRLQTWAAEACQLDVTWLSVMRWPAIVATACARENHAQALALKLTLYGEVACERVVTSLAHRWTVHTVGVHIVMLYLWQIALLRLESLKGPAGWLGLYVVAAQDPAYDLVPKV